jgi:hypothetical protein
MKKLVKLSSEAKFLLFALLFPTVFFSQNAEFELQVNTLPVDEVLQVYQDSSLVISLVKVNYQSALEGIHHERIYYSYENRTDRQLTVSFRRQLNFSHSQNSNQDLNEVSLVLAPFEKKDSDSNPRNKVFYTFSKDYKNTIKKHLESIVVSNITVL